MPNTVESQVGQKETTKHIYNIPITSKDPTN
jgi:hypothetical protein